MAQDTLFDVSWALFIICHVLLKVVVFTYKQMKL